MRRCDISHIFLGNAEILDRHKGINLLLYYLYPWKFPTAIQILEIRFKIINVINYILLYFRTKYFMKTEDTVVKRNNILGEKEREIQFHEIFYGPTILSSFIHIFDIYENCFTV